MSGLRGSRPFLRLSRQLRGGLTYAAPLVLVDCDADEGGDAFVRVLLDGDFGALARGFGDFFYAGVDYFADGFEEFQARVG